MAKYIKHNSNYIRTDRHQFLKGGSTIFERDWVTVGSQLHFGPGKIPYYNDGNFIFTKSPTPFYQKKYKKGTSVATWTYDDVKDASSIVNNIQFNEYTEDIRSFAYYGSCLELVRVSVENIINTFPGMITKNPWKITYPNADETEYIDSEYYGLKNDFGIDFIHKVAKKGEDELKLLRISWDKYLLNNSPIKDYQVTERNMFVLTKEKCKSNRKEEIKETFTFLTEAKHKDGWVKQELNEWKNVHPDATSEEIDLRKLELENSYNPGTSKYNVIVQTSPITLNYNKNQSKIIENGTPINESYYTGFIYYQFGFNAASNNEKSITTTTNESLYNSRGAINQPTYNEFVNVHSDSNERDFKISKRCYLRISYNYSTGILKIVVKDKKDFSTGTIIWESPEYNINVADALGRTLRFKIFNEYTLALSYEYLQECSKEEYEDNYEDSTGVPYKNWTKTDCPVRYWTKNTSFKKECDDKWDYEKHDWNYILYSKLSDIDYLNRPLYEIKIKNKADVEVNIVAYILDYEVVFMTNYDGDVTIRPNDEIIENYFKNLKGFEKQLLTRKTTPLYTNTFVTPLEYNLGYLYYKRTYTWPSNDYCIDISSTEYIDFIERLSKMAETYDELWTDNIWKRMTHEAIKNYDWTYTRRYNDGDEEPNVDGGERMHKVINIIGRIFDDIKREIDTIKQFNRTTYDGDRNIPNALLSDKLELMGWDVFSTIPIITNEIYVNINNESNIITKEEYYNLPTQQKDNYIKNFQYYSASNETITNDFLNNNKLFWYPTTNFDQITFADVDVDWMRRLLLSSKRILSTKGTINSIEMLMGIFGYGAMDDIKPFDIWEEYYAVEPIEYDEPFTYIKKDDSSIIYKEDYDNLDSEQQLKYALDSTFGDMIVKLNLSKTNERLYDDDASGIPIGSFIIDRTTGNGNNEIKNYLIPFYNNQKIYDGNLYFQNNGGWAYNKPGDEPNNVINDFSWTETLSYLHVVSQVSDLLNVNPNSVDDGDIYYVVNVNDYFDNTETGLPLSNFFVLENSYSPENFSSWTNIDITGELYDGDNDEESKKYSDYAAKARYLNDIIPYNIGNNPHVGYGKYDKGNKYYQYMEKPFKYAIDSYNFSYEDRETAKKIMFNINGPINTGNNFNTIYLAYVNVNENSAFKTKSEYDILNDDVKKEYISTYLAYVNENSVFKTKSEYDILNDDDVKKEYKPIYDDSDSKYIVYVKVTINNDNDNDTNSNFMTPSKYQLLTSKEQRQYIVIYKNEEEYEKLSIDFKIYFEVSKKIKIIENGYTTKTCDADGGLKNLPYKEYEMKKIGNLLKKRCNLNSKVLYIKNNLNNEWYIKYFKDVIMNYLLQIIPSTTILILKDFELKKK